MKFIADIKEGETLSGIYLCKKKLTLKNKNGKEYESLTLQDKTGTLDAKIWDPQNVGIDDFSEGDFIEVLGDVKIYMNRYQLSVKRARRCREGEYNPEDYPVAQKHCDTHFGMTRPLRAPNDKQVAEAVAEGFHKVFENLDQLPLAEA